MFGKNPKLAPEKGDGGELKVTSIFLTIQGEGPYVGHQAVFIRLSGCNLACDFCDTEFDSYKLLSVEEIVKVVMSIRDGANLVVITGGEPMRQKIKLLCDNLLFRNFTVQVETNGTIHTEIPKAVKLVCSPKASNGKYHSIRKDILEQTVALKFLISKQNKEYCDISEVGQSRYNIPVYVQPMDEYDEFLNQNNLLLAQQVAKKHCAILSLQLHKILKID